HDRALDDLPAEHERQEALAGRVQRAGRAVEPPVELGRRAWPGGQVAEGQCETLERGPGALARHRPCEPRAGGRVDGQVAELSLGYPVDEADHLVLGEDARDATEEIAERRAEPLDVRGAAAAARPGRAPGWSSTCVLPLTTAARSATVAACGSAWCCATWDRSRRGRRCSPARAPPMPHRRLPTSGSPTTSPSRPTMPR